jgi:hypothetical protein
LAATLSLQQKFPVLIDDLTTENVCSRALVGEAGIDRGATLEISLSIYIESNQHASAERLNPPHDLDMVRKPNDLMGRIVRNSGDEGFSTFLCEVLILPC